MLQRKPKVKGKVLLIPIDRIEASPFQARTQFDEQEIARLALSIMQNGLLQPVSVRKNGEQFQLIAGERRLRACKMAQLQEVPAILCDYKDQQTAALGLLENIQRQNLNPFEQAKGIREVVRLWGCTQEEAAKRLGMAQPTLNNKLRLLSLTDQQQAFCLEHNLTERHARAVLRLEQEEARTKALEQFAKQGMNARQADAHIQKMLNQKERKKSVPMIRDVRIFVNTINKAVRLMVEAGVPASARKKEGEGYVEYIVHIPVAQAAMATAKSE